MEHVFPGNHIKLFNGVLTRTKLDRDGNRRVAYSLRHTYICMRLMEGADIYQIAKNCRTSVEMIEKFYAAHIKNTLDAAAINVRRPKPVPARKPNARGRLTPNSITRNSRSKPAFFPKGATGHGSGSGWNEWRAGQTRHPTPPRPVRCTCRSSSG
jgi:hypothetical protein